MREGRCKGGVQTYGWQEQAAERSRKRYEPQRTSKRSKREREEQRTACRHEGRLYFFGYGSDRRVNYWMVARISESRKSTNS